MASSTVPSALAARLAAGTRQDWTGIPSDLDGGHVANAIEIQAVTKSYGDVVALDEVTLSVAAGEVHGLIGPNGAGKSTLLRILFGLVHPDRGKVALFGKQHSVDGTLETLRAVAGFVDRPRFYPYLTGRQNLALLATVDGDHDP